MNITGLALDWAEAIAGAVDDPEARPAGFAEPHFEVSATVSGSRDNGLYVYHVPDDQLGQGSSFGNALVWCETKGNNDMLSFFSIEAGKRVIGGMSIAYLLPFSDLSAYGLPSAEDDEYKHDSYSRAMPSATGSIHLHPAYQQREFVIGDGLHVLETFFVPRTGMDDPAAAHAVVFLKNRTPHPIGITIIASLDFGGRTPLDLHADFIKDHGALIAWNESNSDWVRVFGGDSFPTAYCATNDEEEAYSPGRILPNRTDDTGRLTGALQYDIILFPNRSHKLRLTTAFSPKGRKHALADFDEASQRPSALKDTVDHYAEVLRTAVVEMPDALLSHGVQWAKACLLRPISRYAVGFAVTNDPGNSTHLVGRDTAWYNHGSDFVLPEAACSMLKVFAERQREDGLIAEYINGNTGESQDYDFNINDNTPLFVMAVAHHIKATGHKKCFELFYEHARRAVESILNQRDEQGLVKCQNDGMGPQAICGWRNVLEYEQITGVVTEINSECCAAIEAFADLAEMRGDQEDACHYKAEAKKLRDAINDRLVNHNNGLYMRNIDLEGREITQVTADMVFPLICGVADDEMTRRIAARLNEDDFMTAAGIRVLPSENPRYDPSFQAGCLGGVWPGVTWWYSMSIGHISPEIMASTLRRAYWHYVADPKVYNTVPGQFSEWSDGQTLVNRGMRLSPWESPRFLWAAIEGIAGIKLECEGVSLDPRLPPDWHWLRLWNLPLRGEKLSYFLIRWNSELHIYTSNEFEGNNITQHKYDEEMPQGAETITTGISATAFRRGDEVLVCLGNSLNASSLGPFLTHHSLSVGTRYRVSRLDNHKKDWEELGVIKGSELQRIAVRINPLGYVLYRFRPDQDG